MGQAMSAQQLSFEVIRLITLVALAMCAVIVAPPALLELAAAASR